MLSSAPLEAVPEDSHPPLEATPEDSHPPLEAAPEDSHPPRECHHPEEPHLLQKELSQLDTDILIMGPRKYIIYPRWYLADFSSFFANLDTGILHMGPRKYLS